MTCAAIAALTLLTGCGDDDDTSADDRTSVSWLETDVCSVLDESAVSELIGAQAAPRPGQSYPQRPECTWAVPGTSRKLVFRLWQPPVPRTLSNDAERTTIIGDSTGYVAEEDKDSCVMHVRAEPAWLSIDLEVPHDGFRPRLCDSVLPTAQQILAVVK